MVGAEGFVDEDTAKWLEFVPERIEEGLKINWVVCVVPALRPCLLFGHDYPSRAVHRPDSKVAINLR